MCYMFRSAVRCRYNVVQYITMLCTAPEWHLQKINQTLGSQQTPHILPSRASYGLFTVNNMYISKIKTSYIFHEVIIKYISTFVAIQISYFTTITNCVTAKTLSHNDSTRVGVSVLNVLLSPAPCHATTSCYATFLLLTLNTQTKLWY